MRERPAGRRAKHQLDVTARHPSGEVTRLIVECKDWDKTVGKSTLDALVGVCSQLKADATAAITTQGFTKGARDVAVDEDVALIRLRPYDPGEGINFIKAVELRFDWYMPSRSNWDFVPARNQKLPPGSTFKFDITDETRLKHLNGQPAETFDQVLQANAAPMQTGTFECRADLGDGRLFPTVGGPDVPIEAITWTEEMQCTQQVVRTEKEGDPCLVMQQLDGNGEPYSGRVFVDKDLHAWTIEDSGDVT